MVGDKALSSWVLAQCFALVCSGLATPKELCRHATEEMGHLRAFELQSRAACGVCACVMLMRGRAREELRAGSRKKVPRIGSALGGEVGELRGSHLVKITRSEPSSLAHKPDSLLYRLLSLHLQALPASAPLHPLHALLAW